MILGQVSERGCYCRLCGEKLPYVEAEQRHRQMLDHLLYQHGRRMVSYCESGRGSYKWTRYEGPWQSDPATNPAGSRGWNAW